MTIGKAQRTGTARRRRQAVPAQPSMALHEAVERIVEDGRHPGTRALAQLMEDTTRSPEQLLARITAHGDLGFRLGTGVLLQRLEDMASGVFAQVSPEFRTFALMLIQVMRGASSADDAYALLRHAVTLRMTDARRADAEDTDRDVAAAWRRDESRGNQARGRIERVAKETKMPSGTVRDAAVRLSLHQPRQRNKRPTGNR